MRRILFALSATLSILFANQALASGTERVLLSASSSTLPGTAQPKADMQTLRATASRQGRISVIVGLRVPFAAEGKLDSSERADQRREIAAAGASLKARYAATLRRAPERFRTLGSLPFAAMDVTPQELDRLAADPEVISIVEDGTLRTSLAESIPLIRANEAWSAGFTGQGQTIAILDTGVDKHHPFLAGKVVSEACFSKGGWCPGGATASVSPDSGMPCPVDCEHGTHVAGIAAGHGESYSGVAKDANLISVQVFSQDPFDSTRSLTYFSDVLLGLNHIYSLRDSTSIAAVNMSLGSGRYQGNCDTLIPALTAAIANLRSAGIATIVASGNAGYTNAISFPACISSAVSVGAVADGNSSGECGTTVADQVTCYSNTSSILSLLAPGSGIKSSVPGGGEKTLEGTSMAAPHVAGAWALLKQKYPTGATGDLLLGLKNTGKIIRDGRVTLYKPRIDVAAALDTFQQLSFTATGEAQGGVNFSTDGGTSSCTDDCTRPFVAGAEITLKPAPVAGAAFVSWSGACSGTGACKLILSGPTAVTAEYKTAPILTLNYRSRGRGTGGVSFSPAGAFQTCTGACSASFSEGTFVTVTPEADTGSTFAGWSGACRKKNRCIIEMSAAKTVTATFNPAKKKKRR
ncbi:S8 family serine peptidase [Aestuariivirga sp.]|uniref:S8 family serine peptidase n=1 Tax=Aestuariivirga sp. TaxID=2650926 RepID=UPI003BACCDCC